VRSIIRTEKPDMMWFMTDPRFFGWLWEIEDEIRPLMPMIYYHVWDNYPYPDYNEPFYSSNDVVVSISKVTDDIVRHVSPGLEVHHIPHAVDSEVFKPMDKEEKKLAKQQFMPDAVDKFVVFWNNRNARRKMPGSLIFYFNEFLKKVGKDKAQLIMHTDVHDPNGPNLEEILHKLNITNGEVKFSTNKIETSQLAVMYNLSDVTINISDAEGFGLSTLESLSCGTPIIVNMTGGLQEQVTDGENWFGVGIEPAAKAIIGSQDVPYIYEDRVSQEGVVDALMELYNKRDELEEIGELGREYVLKNYNYKKYCKNWDALLKAINDRYGSWETRRNYQAWELIEV
jgi:glycosyltransferase involved in cell wall biosynthesis